MSVIPPPGNQAQIQTHWKTFLRGLFRLPIQGYRNAPGLKTQNHNTAAAVLQTNHCI